MNAAPRSFGVEDIADFDTLIDARSPAEYALDHIPGAINCPVLDDEERRFVGTIYKQRGAFEAKRVGGAMVAAHLAEHLRTRFADMPRGWRPLVYCWRGGLRSGSFVQWLRLVGWDAQQLNGGYKRWRGHVIECIDQLAPQLPLRVLCGATGSAKTRVLQALAIAGEQVLDLEDLAAHKGSVLGGWPGRPQPSQKAFETQLAAQLKAFDLTRPGIGLYGGTPGPGTQVARIEAQIVQVREVAAGGSVGYGATFVADRAMRVAILNLGYADGYRRAFSGGQGSAGGHTVVGRVSMDLITLDVTDAPDAAAQPGGIAVAIGDGRTVDAVAADAGTIGYEILTGLGARYRRVYRG